MNEPADRLRRVLAAYDFPALQQAEWQSLGNAGGFSGAELFRTEVDARKWLLRCWPRQHPSPRRLEFVHAVLAHAERNGCKGLAQPLATRDGRTFLESSARLWQLEPWVPGVADFVTNGSPAKAVAAVEALAGFHQAVDDWTPAGEGQPTSVGERIDRLAECRTLLSWQLPHADAVAPSLRFAVHAAEDYRRLAATLVDSVERRLRRLPERVPLRPAIRDIWTDHVYFEGDRVSGIVDFGAMRLDWQLIDVARLLGSLDQVDSGGDGGYFECGLQAYRESRSLDAEPTGEAVRTLDDANTLVAPMSWISWLLFEGRRFDDLARVSERLEAAMGRLRRLAGRDGKLELGS